MQSSHVSHTHFSLLLIFYITVAHLPQLMNQY